MSQKLPVDNFEWEENISQFDESLIKNYDENSGKGYTVEVDVEYSKKLQKKHNDVFIYFSYILSHKDRDLKVCSIIASDKSNLLRKDNFLLESGLQVTVFLILLEVGYLVTVVLNFVYK